MSAISRWWQRVLAKLRARYPAPTPEPAPVPLPAPPAPPQPEPVPTPPTAPPAPPVATGDAIDITGARLLGPHARRGDPAKARVIRFLAGAHFARARLWLEYRDFPEWPTADGEPGTCARNFLYWRDSAGNMTGGHFEWSTAGRRERLLKNIYPSEKDPDGYLNEQPPKGAPCWTCTVRNNWTERSNVVEVGAWPG